MTVSNTGNENSQLKTPFRFFPSMTMGGLTRINRYIPKKFSLVVTAFTFIARFAFQKFLMIREQVLKNQQKQTVEKTPLPQPAESETLPLVALKPALVVNESQPAVVQNRIARTYADRRAQLLSSKV